MKKIVKILVCLLMCHTMLLAQSTDNSDRCQSEEVQKKMDLLYPKMKQAREIRNKELSRQIQNGKSQRVPMTYTIPVVFHVVHGRGAENITDSQIQESVAQMNEDYNGLDPDRGSVVSAFKNIYANVGFKFVLARLDPNGNPTDGITRHYDIPGSNQANGDEGPMKDRYRWPREKYLNVYVLRAAGLEKGSAWAYYPGINETLDGVVSSHWAVGRTGTATPTHHKIMTHEVGHWANLAHTFQDGCEGNGDSVADTPPCTTGSGCNITDVSCGVLSNRQNYMDYGTCTVMFTEGQKSRMVAAIEGSASKRNNLWTTQNLTSTGVIGQPVSPLFSIGKNFTTPGGSIVFDEKSEAEVGNITSWSWSFPGGTPSSYNGKNPPEITYNTSGVYDVTLTVSNGTSSNTVTKKDYIIVDTNIYMHNNTLTIVNGKLYDEAYNGRYSVREDHTLTLLPGVAGTKLNVDFTTFKLFNEGACGVPLENDFLKIYDGPDTNSPLLGTYCASNSPGSITATNPQGALTFYFHTNVENREEGFVADISCKSGPNDLPVANFNSSTSSVSAYQSVTFKDQSVGATQWSWTFPGGSPSASTQQNPVIGYTTPGTYDVTLVVTNSNGSHTKVKSSYVVVGSASCESLPYKEDFESDFRGISQLADDDFDWLRHTGATKSSKTGPSKASSGSYYLYTESTTPNFPTKKANVITKCLDFKGVNDIVLSFDYHMYGENMGSLEAQVSNDGGGSWSTLWSQTGNRGDYWRKVNLDLSELRGQVGLIRFNAVTGSDHTSDIAIDNISVFEGVVDTEKPAAPSNLVSTGKTAFSVDLSWEASTDNIGVVSYEVYNDKNSEIVKVTGTTARITGLTSVQEYNFTVKALDGAGNLSPVSNSVSVTTLNTTSDQYCSLRGRDSRYSRITNVKLGSINNTSAESTYTDYTNIITSLKKGIAHNISVSLNQGGASTDNLRLRVWGDWNNDNDFIDGNEMIINEDLSGNLFVDKDYTWSGNISIPLGASVGTTRIRIMVAFRRGDEDPGPCGDYESGEVEDYTINITTGDFVDNNPPTAPSKLTSVSKTQTSVNLNWTASTDDIGVTAYDIYNGNTVATTVNGTTTDATVSGLTANTAYTFTVKAKDAAGNVSGASNSISVTTLNTSSQYCIPEPTYSQYSHITNVSMGSINNTSTGAEYEDYSSISTSVNQGSSQNISVSLNQGLALADNVRIRAWADWNNDSDFIDGNEMIINEDISGSLFVNRSYTWSGSISIPAEASVGATRIRILVAYKKSNENPGPCGSYESGEAEDYTINVQGVYSGSAVNSFEDMIIYPNSTKGLFVILSKSIGAQVILTSSSGAIVKNAKITSEKTEIDLSGFPSGIYQVQLILGSKRVSKTIVKE